MLKIINLRASIEGKEILKGVDLEVGAGRWPGGRSGPEGEIHVLMGPNGSGKSTLAQVIAGHPSYIVNSGSLIVNGEKINKLMPNKRAKLGIFLAFQHPVEIPGVSVFNVLRRAKQTNSPLSLRAKRGERSNLNKGKRKVIYFGLAGGGDLGKARELRQELVGHLASLKLPEDFLSRSLNEGFSGGEKKRSEIMQMMVLKPKLVILDEIDSGLDVDGLKIVAGAIKQFKANDTGSSFLLITHYARILKYLKPDFVHIMMDGKIIKSGKMDLAKQIEEKGYQTWQTA